MKASYKLWRQAEGRGAFAEVEVASASSGAKPDLEGCPEDWVAWARRGVARACAELALESENVVLIEVIGTHVDTTRDAMIAAAFLAVAKLKGVDGDYELQHEDGWRVVTSVSDG